MNWWTTFTDSFEQKGTQILLLWFTDMTVLAAVIFFWKHFDDALQTTLVGILSGINGAFLGAMGARALLNNGNGNGTGPGLPMPPIPPAPPATK